MSCRFGNHSLQIELEIFFTEVMHRVDTATNKPLFGLDGFNTVSCVTFHNKDKTKSIN